MSFLYPAFLFGLLSLAIPIILHFFNLQKPKEVLFTNVRFLRNVQEVTTSKLKLKHLLVLLCRLLFLLFLILAFAQPVIRAKNAELLSGENHVSIYLDNSLSMENQIDENRSLDFASAYISSLNRLFSPSTNYLLLTNDFERKDLTIKNFDKLQERITEINYSPKYRELNDIILREQSLSGQFTSDKKRSIFIFSDFQKTTAGDLSRLTIDTSVQYFIIPVQNREVSNLFVDSVWLAEPLVQVNSNITIRARIRNSGKEAAEKVNVRLFFDDVQMNNSVVDLDPYGEKTLDFSFTMKDSAPKRGIIRLEDHPIQFDNDYYFVVNTSSKIKIYQIYQNEKEVIEHVYQNQTLFGIRSSAIGEVDYSAVEEADLVILNGLTAINQHLADVLVKRIQAGVSVAIFPGANVDVASYGNVLQRVKLNPVKADTSDTKGYVLSNPDVRNPFFKDVFEKEDRNLSLPYAFPTVKPSVNGNEILRFKNGSSFLSAYSSSSKGMVYLFAAPLNSTYTNFHQHALFVPVMYRMAFLSMYSVGRPAYSFQEKTIVIPLETGGEAVFTLENGDEKYVPVQKQIDNKLYLELPAEELKSGFYWLTNHEKIRVPLALNASSVESVMDFYSAEELKNVFKDRNNIEVLETDSPEDFYSVFKNKNIGTSLWKYCLILSLIFLLTEILLIRFL